jgi:NAD(P)-dependent dehydrogenase (short-subunit alcohol dehydrogenase family)
MDPEPTEPAGRPPTVDLSETVALVTGASRGIGRGIAHELGVAGATVYVTGRSTAEHRTDDLPGTVDGTADLVDEAGGRGVPVRCDHADAEQVAEVFERIEREAGRLDCLVNNVWGGYEGYDDAFDAPFWEQPLERWDRMFDVGVRSAFVATKLAVPLLFESESRLVVNVSAGDEGKFRGSVPYDVAKTAVDRLALGAAHELRERGVAVVGLYPGFTRTERVMEATDDLHGTESPRYAGRAVAALAGDRAKMDHSGGIYKTGTLARTYDFTDVDGSQPEPFVFEGPRL